MFKNTALNNWTRRDFKDVTGFQDDLPRHLRDKHSLRIAGRLRVTEACE